MEQVLIESALARAEIAAGSGEGLAGTGFWKAVSEVKTDPQLIEAYADRISAIDQEAFGNWALYSVSLARGTWFMLATTVLGVAFIVWSSSLSEPISVLAFFLGMGALLVSTHGLAHLLAGRTVGIHFTAWFIGTITRPQPGVKVDYSSYLRTDASKRAWMHASGAIVTKAVPFLLIGPAIVVSLPVWAIWVLPIVGVVTIVTDVVWSTGQSDWKKFSRERAFAQRSRSG